MKRLFFDRTSTGLIFKIILLLVISVLIEVFVFNFRFFLPRLFGAHEVTIPASNFTDFSNDVSSGAGGVALRGNTVSFTIPNVGVPVYTIRLNTTGSYDSFSTAVSYEDDSFSKSFLDAGTWVIRPAVGGSNYINFITAGNCRNISLTLQDLTGAQANITSVTVNAAYFSFCLPRFLMLFLAFLLIILTVHYRLWNKALDFKRNWQVFAVAIVLISSFFLTFLIFSFNNTDPPISPDVIAEQQDSYQYLTQAMYNGRFDFAVSPPASLQSLSNPYDPSQRSGDFMWDSIYYKGKFYSYFGIAPVVTLLLPFKAITGYYLSTSFACLIFVLLSIAAALKLYLSIMAAWFKKVNFLMFISGAAAVCFSNIFWLIARPSFYELAEAAAIAFLLLALNMLFATLSPGRGTGRRLILAGLFFGLMVASRPTFIFYIAAALPFLFKSIVKEAASLKKRLTRVLCFFTPLGVFAILIGGYNYLRFGSPFDFGIEYQLTVSDLRYNKITNFVQVINGFYHYFLQPLSIDLKFPFFHVVSVIPSSAAEYYFNFPTAGIFCFPLMIVLVAAVYIIKRSMREDRLKKWFIAIMLICCLLITYLDITLAGVLMRYTLDIYPMLLICALVLWMEIYLYFSRHGAGAPVTKLFAATAAATILITCFTCVVGENNLFSQNQPALYQYVSGIFEFWR